MQSQNQVQQFATSEEFLLPLSEEEQVVVTGGGGKHRASGPKHAKPSSLLSRGLGLGLKVGARTVPVVGTALTIFEGAKLYRKSSIHNKKGKWWSFL